MKKKKRKSNNRKQGGTIKLSKISKIKNKIAKTKRNL